MRESDVLRRRHDRRGRVRGTIAIGEADFGQIGQSSGGLNAKLPRVLPAFLLGLAVLASVGLVRILLSQRADRQYLEAGDGDAPLQLDHLSIPLRAVVREARAVRISLDAPLRSVRARSPQAQAELASASRELADWLARIDRLSAADRALIQDSGAPTNAMRERMVEASWALGEVGGQGPSDPAAALERTIADLRQVERALCQLGDPYRK